MSGRLISDFNAKDRVERARWAAYMNRNIAEISELSVYISGVDLSAKLQIYLQKFNESSNLSKYAGAHKELSILIASVFKEKGKTAEKLLLISTALKLSLKQLFELAAKHLFYIMLYHGGCQLRSGFDLTEVSILLEN